MPPAELARQHALQDVLDRVAPLADEAALAATSATGDDREYLTARTATLDGLRSRLMASLAGGGTGAPERAQTGPQRHRRA